MRTLSCLLLVGLFSLAISVRVAGAQGKKDKKDDTSQIYDIGGRSLEEWIKLIHSKDRSKAETAIRTLLQFPVDRAYQAVPDLLSELKKHTFNTPIDISIRVNLSITIGAILGHAKGPSREHVTEAVTLLTRLTKDTQSIVRYRAAEALGMIGPEAKAATPDLMTLLKDTGTWEVRQMAAVSLGRVAYDGKNGPPLQVLTVLYSSLGDPASQVRLASIQALTFLGPPADPKMRAGLMNALAPVAAKDPEPTVEIWANMSLLSLNDGVNHQQWLNPILKFAKHTDPYVRLQAIQAIGTIGGKKVQGAVPDLLNMMNDPDSPPALMLGSMWALGRVGVWADEAITPLQKIIADPKKPEPLKKAAQETLDTIQGKGKKDTK